MTFSFSKFKIYTKRSNRNIYFQKFLHEKYPMTHIASVCVTIIYNYFYMKIAFLFIFFFSKYTSKRSNRSLYFQKFLHDKYPMGHSNYKRVSKLFIFYTKNGNLKKNLTQNLINNQFAPF